MGPNPSTSSSPRIRIPPTFTASTNQPINQSLTLSILFVLLFPANFPNKMTITVAFGDANLSRLCHRRNFLSPPPKLSPNENVRYAMIFVYPSYGKRWLGTTAESIHPEFSGSENAYEVLGVAETSSFDEVKASFRKLAKETHPDLVSSSDSDSSKRFVEILAAYEVKHMHWFQLQDEASVCECRCTRAKLPSSKYWLFEPRCSMHDIGGWYIETYGRDKKNKNIPSQRFWDSINAHEQIEKRLHPAVYLLALAYRTLDIENARGTKRNFKDVAKGNLFEFFRWCKKLV